MSSDLHKLKGAEEAMSHLDPAGVPRAASQGSMLYV